MAAPRFADAVAKYDEARMVLFGVPYDRTCSFRGGSRFAPRAIREASYNFETYMMDHQRDLRDIPVADLGDLPPFGAPAEMVTGVRKMAPEFDLRQRLRCPRERHQRIGRAGGEGHQSRQGVPYDRHRRRGSCVRARRRQSGAVWARAASGQEGHRDARRTSSAWT